MDEFVDKDRFCFMLLDRIEKLESGMAHIAGMFCCRQLTMIANPTNDIVKLLPWVGSIAERVAASRVEPVSNGGNGFINVKGNIMGPSQYLTITSDNLFDPLQVIAFVRGLGVWVTGRTMEGYECGVCYSFGQFQSDGAGHVKKTGSSLRMNMETTLAV